MNIPKHIGIIVDGNGRWATKRGKKRSDGHLAGAKNLNNLCQHIFNKGIYVLSLYIFSTENFKRSKEEVNYLMELFVKMFKKDFKLFENQDIKIVFSGRREPLRQDLLNIIDEITYKTKDNKQGIINFCLNYGSHFEIIDACKKIVNSKIEANEITEAIFKKNLYNDLPDLDLIIRTGGELRLSNFMLWQAAYAEFYFTNTLFPDFQKEEFDLILSSYFNRDRRFGGVKNEKKIN